MSAVLLPTRSSVMAKLMRPSDHIALEVCIDTASGLEACAGLVDRIELCAGLDLGGLTPSAGLMTLAKTSGLETHVLIRPRTGNFDYDQGELNTILEDINLVRSLGLHGVVVGATKDRALDRDALLKICAAAEGLDVTLHRAIDVVNDPAKALEVAVDCGISRILTSGGAKTAIEGSGAVRALRKQAAGRIDIMAGSGVKSTNVGQLIGETGVKSVHASCSIRTDVQAKISGLGFGTSQRRTSRDEIKKMRSALDRC